MVSVRPLHGHLQRDREAIQCSYWGRKYAQVLSLKCGLLLPGHHGQYLAGYRCKPCNGMHAGSKIGSSCPSEFYTSIFSAVGALLRRG